MHFFSFWFNNKCDVHDSHRGFLVSVILFPVFGRQQKSDFRRDTWLLLRPISEGGNATRGATTKPIASFSRQQWADKDAGLIILWD